jgi:flavin reductase (DIM6/NTAB) family NADH-FMN oxidoreductase RutF
VSATAALQPDPHLGVDPRAFRAAMSRFATGVTVVTAHAGGSDVAMTANSFTSVSMEPLLVSVAVRNSARWEAAVRTSSSFVVNVLSADQQHIADTFARNGRGEDDRPLLDLLPHTRSLFTGSAVLDEALAVVHCTVYDLVQAGDHVLVLGQVVDVYAADPAPALLFVNGRYATLDGPA